MYVRNELVDGSMRTIWDLLYFILKSNIIARVVDLGADEKEKVKLATYISI